MKGLTQTEMHRRSPRAGFLAFRTACGLLNRYATAVSTEWLAAAKADNGTYDMNLYTILSSGAGSQEAADLGARLSAWHDAMVAHERLLRVRATGHGCDDECAHAEARVLWREAVATFGARAQELVFLRSRAEATRRLKTPRTATAEL